MLRGACRISYSIPILDTGDARRLGVAAVLQSGELGSSLVGSSSLAAYIQVFGGEGGERGL